MKGQQVSCLDNGSTFSITREQRWDLQLGDIQLTMDNGRVAIGFYISVKEARLVNSIPQPLEPH